MRNIREKIIEKKKEIMAVAIMLIIASILLVGKKIIKNYDVYVNSNSFEYMYYFDDDDSTPITYYNDKKNNCTYIKICTYDFEYKPSDEFYDNKKIINPENLIKKVSYSILTGKAEICLDKNNLKKEDLIKEVQDRFGDFMPEATYRKEDATIFLKINNLYCSRIKLKVGKNKYTAKPSKEKGLKEITNKYFLDYKKNHSINYNEYNYFSLCNKNKYGLIDIDGKIVLDFISDKEILFNERLKLLIINKDGLDYLADFSGNIISKGYEDLAFINNVQIFSHEEDYIDYIIVSELNDKDKNISDRIKISGLRKLNDRKKYGLMDKKGNLVAPIVYEKFFDIFLEAKFRFIKMDDSKYIITDLEGNRLNNNTYSDIEKAMDGYYIVTYFENDYKAVIDYNGKKISEDYKNLKFINSELILFETGTYTYEKKILDKNFKTRIEGMIIEEKENYKIDKQPYFEGSGMGIKIDGVTFKEGGTFKLIYLDDNTITMQEENYKGNIVKIISVVDGKLVEE